MSNPFENVSLQDIPKILPKLSLQEQEVLLAQLAHLEKLKTRDSCRSRFLSFVKHVWPTFIAGRHHAIMANAFERVAKGELKRLIINMPPRHTKSEFASYLFPAWFLGQFPDEKVIQTSHTAELAVGFGRKVRNLVDTDVYHELFPQLVLSADSKAAGRWNTSKQGDYFAIGVGGAVTGKGADCAYFSCKIRTKRGILPISDVRVGDYVEGYNHATKQIEWTRVLAVSTQFKPELVNVNGIWVTPDHRVYTRAGYQPAGAARDVAVSGVREGLSAEALGALAEPSKASEEPGGLLFVRVLPYSEASAGLPVWEQEKPDRLQMQDLLLGANQGRGFLRTLRDTVQEVCVRVSEGGRASRGGLAALLYQRVLYQLATAARRRASTVYRALQRLWGPLARQTQNLLLNRLLQRAQWRLWGIRGGLELSEAAGAAARQQAMRLLWAGETAGGSASYRPQRGQQRAGERDYALRTVPQPLSSSRLGVSASDLRPLLQGEGYWVVDIQTGTSNFFSEGKLLHNCLIIDDPHSEQEAALAETSPEIYDKVYEWYTSGPRQRLQPGGAIVIVMTRWGMRDLTAQVLKAAAQRGGDEWEVIEFPAIMPSGNPLWPEFWSLEELSKLKEELPNSKWMAQYQQSPTSDAAATIKREWWRTWEEDEPPACDYIVQSWDTAFEANNKADYSAGTTWGVFYRPDNNGQMQANLILLNAVKVRMEFPSLKRLVLEQYDEYKPDSLIIEKKASGAPLVYELRAMGIPLQDYTPVRGTINNPNNKMARLNAISDLFASGIVWAPNRSWAEEVIDELAAFPAGEHDDYVDSTIMALLRFRQGGFLRLPTDEAEPERFFKGRRHGAYY